MLKASVLFLIALVFYYSGSKFLIVLILACYHVIYPQVYSKIKLHYKPSSFTERILEKCKSLQFRYHPTIWLFNGILQAIFEGTIGDSNKKTILVDELNCTREEIVLPDGGLISIDWTNNKNSENLQKILIIGPGLTGNSNSEYVRSVAFEAIKRNFAVAILLGRGIGGNKLKVKSS